MKKRLFTLALAIVLCFGLTTPASAEFIQFEDSAHFGASTWSSSTFYPADGIDVSEQRNEFEKATGLTVFLEETIDNDGGFRIPRTYYGLKDDAGNVVLPMDFSKLVYLDDGNILVKRKRENGKVYQDDMGGYGIYTTNGKAVIAASYDNSDIEYADDETGNFLISRQTKEVYQSQVEYFVLGMPKGLYDQNGKELLPVKYAHIDYMGDGYYRIQEGHKDGDGSLYWSYGVYKYGVGIVIPCQRDIGISYLGSDMFRMRYSAFCYGVVDGNNKQILAPIYAGIHSYCDGYFAVALARSQKDYQQAVKDNAACDNYDSGHHTGDNSLNEAYVTMGIVDKNGNTYTSFDHDMVSISESGKIELMKWNGGHEWYYPYPNMKDWTELRHYIKTYDKETTSLTALTATGKTASDILRVRGITLPGMTDNVPSVSTIGGFTDVKSSDYFADAVLWAVEKNITSGTSATTFSPGATCNRAQILTFLWRANGSPEPTAANPFTDINSADYYYKAALWAAEKGLVSGSAFGGGTDCTRAMTVEYLWKAAGSPTVAKQASFNDVPNSADYAQAVAWAVENGITSGTGGGNFSPTATCTRGQIVTFLHRAMG